MTSTPLLKKRTALVLLGLCSLSVNAQQPPSRMTLQELKDDESRQIHSQVIKQVDGQDLVLLSCKPDGWKENDKRTAFVWIHGGGFTGGHPEQFTTHMKYAAARGAVGFGIQYRLIKSPGYKVNNKLSEEENQKLRAEKYQAFMEGPSIQDLIDDCADAIRYIRKHADALGVDPDRIVVSGDSAGAFLVNALGTMVPKDATPNVLIPCSSISDLTIGFGREYAKPADGQPGKELEDDPERLARAQNLSPVNNITQNGTSWLVLIGSNDWLKDEPKAFYDALKAKGLDAEYILYHGAKHAFVLTNYSATDEQITTALLDMDAFLVKRGLLEGPSLLAMPADAVRTPIPPLPLPEGAKGLTYDCNGNFWTLIEERLHVLPARDQSAWIPDELSGVPEGKWRHVLADANGYLWLSDGKSLYSMSPYKPENGWIDVSAIEGYPKRNDIRKLALSPSGGLQPVFKKAVRLEFIRDRKDVITIRPVKSTDWQETWELVARLPAGSHDLSGDVLNGKFYMDWAIGNWGYPVTGNFHRNMLEYDPAKMTWKVVADYGVQRAYCAVGVLDGKIWTVSGDSINEEGERYTTVLSQIWDPTDGSMTQGPDLPVAIPAALGFGVGDRLYVLGFTKGEKGVPNLLKLFSIGRGETSWTTEPEGPEGGGSSYGTALDGKLYSVVDNRYLAIFDTKTKTWSTSDLPQKNRSPAVAHFQGEIWVMGGRGNPQGSHIYNPSNDTWRKGPDLPREMTWGCGFTIEGDLYLTGGFDYRSFNDRTFRLRNPGATAALSNQPR